MSVFDRTYFLFNKLRFYNSNKAFKKSHVGFALPPDYLMYESYLLDYKGYYEDGKETAQWILQELSTYIDIQNKRVLDWGCGPARVVRHLPLYCSGSFFGTNYNETTIDWCLTHIPDVSFSLNRITPPTNYDDNYFDVIYELSVFTHLSLENHSVWEEELYRLLKSNGILLITTQGQAFRSKLSSDEKQWFDRGNLVERGKVKEGDRSFSAYHPSSFVINLFEGRWKSCSIQMGK